MTNKITNQLTYQLFLWLNILVVLSLLGFACYFIYGINSGMKNPFQYYHLNIYPVFIFLYGLIRYKLSPNYFEAEISHDRIIIKTINPSQFTGLRFISLILNQVELSKFVVDRASFTNYRIVIDQLGFRKRLILQKNVNGNLFESQPIRLDYLGYGKYTNLLLSIERLSQKMSLN